MTETHSKSFSRLALLVCLLPFHGALFAATITLNNGDQLSGEILHEDDQTIQLRHPALGTLTIAKSNLQPAETAEPEPAEDEATVDNGLLGTGFLEGWKRSLGIGLKGSEGNSQNNSFHADLNFSIADEEIRRQFNLDYDRKTEDGTETENDLLMQLENDHLMPDSRWFWFHRERFDWDRFEDWDYRFGGFIGPGYDFIKTETLRTSGRLGIGGTNTWGGDDEGLSPELLLGADAAWTISDAQSLTASNAIYPNLEELGEFRNITRLDWKWKLSDLHRGVALKFGIINEYESMVADDAKHNDFKYNLSLDIGL